MSELSITLHFAEQKMALNWGDLLWGYRRALLTWKDLIRAANARLIAGSDDPLEMELACVDKDSVWKVGELAEKLAQKDCASEDVVKRKWLYLLLAWVYEHRTEFVDPLEQVEEIYSDFDYPSEIESFVRYMPPMDGYIPNQHSLEENHQRLMRKWREFLDGLHSGDGAVKRNNNGAATLG